MKLLQGIRRSHPPTIFLLLAGTTWSCSNILWRRRLGRATFCLPLCFGLGFKDLLFHSSFRLRPTLSLRLTSNLALTLVTPFGFLVSFQSDFLLPWRCNKMIHVHIAVMIKISKAKRVTDATSDTSWFPKCCNTISSKVVNSHLSFLLA